MNARVTELWRADEKFDSVVRSSYTGDDCRWPDEDALADIIEQDGRKRIALGLGCPLGRYLEGVPDLPNKPVALDAAIDIALRGLQGMKDSPLSVEQSVAELLRVYPNLSEQIGVASVLSRQLDRSIGAERSFLDPQRRIGMSFGPEVENLGLRYQVERLLGTGSNGAVYLASDRLLSDPGHAIHVAIKFLHKGAIPDTLSSSQLSPPPDVSIRRQRARLLDEARRTRRIEHPNIVRVLDYGSSGDQGAFVVSETVHGENLQDRLDRNRDPLAAHEAARLVSQAARGVHAAHLAGVLHCDLKPSNILVDSENVAHVADFGAAAVLSEVQGDGTAPLGNVAFAAPEQFRQEHSSLDAKTDVYALGGVLFYLVTKQYPNGSTLGSIRSHHSHSMPLARQELDGLNADRAFEAICKKALSPAPDARYQSAEAFADDLDAWLVNRPISAWRAPAAARVALFVRRNPRLTKWSLLVAIVLAGLGVVTLVRTEQLRQARQMIKGEEARAAKLDATRREMLDGIKGMYKDLKSRPPGTTFRSDEDVKKFMQPLLDHVEPEAAPAHRP